MFESFLGTRDIFSLLCELLMNINHHLKKVLATENKVDSNVGSGLPKAEPFWLFSKLTLLLIQQQRLPKGKL